MRLMLMLLLLLLDPATDHVAWCSFAPHPCSSVAAAAAAVAAVAAAVDSPRRYSHPHLRRARCWSGCPCVPASPATNWSYATWSACHYAPRRSAAPNHPDRAAPLDSGRPPGRGAATMTCRPGCPRHCVRLRISKRIWCASARHWMPAGSRHRRRSDRTASCPLHRSAGSTDADSCRRSGCQRCSGSSGSASTRPHPWAPCWCANWCPPDVYFVAYFAVFRGGGGG
ncbi:hypothetical protein M5D96_006748, partial [Drosophila gunungcola]